jgi:putative transposase
MFQLFLKPLHQIFDLAVGKLDKCLKKHFTPAKANLAIGTFTDVTRSKSSLVAENAMLRQQLIVLQRQVNKPTLRPIDRVILVILAGLVKNWRQALLIVKPETLLKWHRAGFKLFWKFKSRAKGRKPKIPEETILLIKKMACENRLWGAERIQGELLNLNIKVSKRTIQKYMRQAKPPRSTSQNWSTFLKNHSHQIWACDFLPVNDIFFRQIYAFVIMELGSRKIIHIGVTAHPTDEWSAQQLREATPFEQRPKYLIRDNDAKFGSHFKQVAQGAGIEVLKTPVKAPNANANCERLMGTLRRELLDHFLIFNEQHLKRVLKEFVEYYNSCRPHQGIGQATPIKAASSAKLSGEIVSFPVLGGLHHHYHRVAYGDAIQVKLGGWAM